MNFENKLYFQNELSNIRTIFINSGCPEVVINTAITRKIYQFRRPTQLGPKKCLIYLHLPWLSNISIRHKMRMKTAVKRCYFAIEPRIVCTTRQLLSAAKKDVVKDSPLERDESSIIVVTGGRPGPSSHCSLSKHQFKIKQ